MCQMRDDDVAVLVALPARPRADLAVAGLVDLQQVMRFGNDFAAGRIIGCRHESAELFDVRVRVLEQMQTRGNQLTQLVRRSEERRVGKEGASTCRSRCSPYP